MLALIFSVPKIPKLQVDERENSEKSRRAVTTQFPAGLKAGAVPGRPSSQQPAAMWPSRRPHWRRDGCKCGRPPAWPHPPRGRSPSFLPRMTGPHRHAGLPISQPRAPTCERSPPARPVRPVPGFGRPGRQGSHCSPSPLFGRARHTGTVLRCAAVESVTCRRRPELDPLRSSASLIPSV